MKALSIAGTAAMFLVGGGILLHGIPGAEHYIGELLGLASSQTDSFSAAVWKALGPAVAGGLTGLIAGFPTLAAVTLVKRLRSWRVSPAADFCYAGCPTQYNGERIS